MFTRATSREVRRAQLALQWLQSRTVDQGLDLDSAMWFLHWFDTALEEPNSRGVPRKQIALRVLKRFEELRPDLAWQPDYDGTTYDEVPRQSGVFIGGLPGTGRRR